MNKTYHYRRMLCAALVVSPLSSFAEDSISDAIAGGKVNGNFRLRYENVAPNSPTPLLDATALTLRSRLGYETAPFEGITAYGEFEDTHVIGGYDEYAPTTPKGPDGKTSYANIVDPEQTEINQAYLRYRGVSKLDVILGRQRILLDNQRFVGNVGWRQNEQTYDAFSAAYKGIADWSFYYAYINAVHGIAGVKPTLNFNFKSDDHLANISYSGFVIGKITAYAYLLNNDEPLSVLQNQATTATLNPALVFKSNNTYGLRFDGNYVLPITLPIRLLYTAEYAQQTLTTPTDIDRETTYSLFDVGAAYTTKIGVLSARIAQETMGSDNGLQGFQTPYATKHAFNGWDDMFLNTPNEGLNRQFLTLAADLQPYGVKIMTSYGTFSKDYALPSVANNTGDDFGSEFDAQLLKSFGPKYTLGVKYASYSAESTVKGINNTAGKPPGTNNFDTDKYWLWAEMNF